MNKYKPGAGRRKKYAFDKGRQLDPVSISELKSILGDMEIRRDLLIEYLHIINDHFNGLHTKYLRALAEIMKISMAEVFEVATFYAHFTVIDDEELRIPDITIRVCESLTCNLFKSDLLYSDLVKTHGAKVRVLKAPCMGMCDLAPALSVGHQQVGNATVSKVSNIIETKDLKPQISKFISFTSYRSDGGYELLKNFKSGVVSYDDISDCIKKADLKGRGGAGFPAAKKWEFVRAYSGNKMMCINGDEGEPGTFKDKYYLDMDPHRFLEGTLIAAHAVNAEKCFVYMRDEYPANIHVLKTEINILEKKKIIPENFLEVRRGAGAYICGEESALIESVEGKRGLPRHRPPYVAEVGVFGNPTLVHNIETVYWIREIYERGADWFLSHKRNGSSGLRSYSVSGYVNKPGVKLAPAGISLNELITEYCGGMIKGHKLKAYLPGGASGGILPSTLADLPLDFGKLEEHGCFIGSAAVIVLSDRVSMKNVALNLMKFFEEESCGQCTPCRNGTTIAVELMKKNVWDLELLNEVSEVMTNASICGLGQAAANPLLGVIKHFSKEIVSV